MKAAAPSPVLGKRRRLKTKPAVKPRVGGRKAVRASASREMPGGDFTSTVWPGSRRRANGFPAVIKPPPLLHSVFTHPKQAALLSGATVTVFPFMSRILPLSVNGGPGGGRFFFIVCGVFSGRGRGRGDAYPFDGNGFAVFGNFHEDTLKFRFFPGVLCPFGNS